MRILRTAERARLSAGDPNRAKEKILSERRLQTLFGVAAMPIVQRGNISLGMELHLITSTRR